MKCAENLCGKKTTGSVVNKNENVFFSAFLAGCEIKECGTPAFSRPPRLSLVPRAKKRKALAGRGVKNRWGEGEGEGVGKNKTKIKQRLRNERRKPFTKSCLRGYPFFFPHFPGGNICCGFFRGALGDRVAGGRRV